jgi:drug/metabolite transporter (DMT)-like permease
MPNEFNFFKNKDLAKQIIDSQSQDNKQKIEQGWLGKFWGSASSIPHNIAALAILLLLLTGIAYTFFCFQIPSNNIGISIKDFWSIITPIITLSIGYLFGEKQKKID